MDDKSEEMDISPIVINKTEVTDNDPLSSTTSFSTPSSSSEEITATATPRKMLSKEQLSSASCCRLCAQGTQQIETEADNIKWFSLFNEENSLQEIPIHRIINKYLPIEVLESDSFYPKVICQDCFECVEKTIQFFDKICAGQRLLANILNTFNSGKPLKSVSGSFSEDNPLLKPAKRRGRPRKKIPPEETLIESKNLLSDVNPRGEIITPELTERRAKRQSRPPVRYVDEVLSSTSKNNELLLEGRDNTTDHIPHPPTTQTGVAVPSNDVTAFVNFSFHTDLSHMNQQSLTDLGKLGVLLSEGVSKMEDNTDLTSSESNIGIAVGSTTNNGDDPTELDAGSKEDERKDKTVKLSDLYSKKRIKRRKKKKVDRKNKPKIQCEQCPKAFNHSSSLVYHRLSVHDKTKNFACNVCGRTFAHKQVLNNHKFVHADDRYFNCESCPAKFKSRASLYTHKKSRHSAVREHTCDVCGSQFSLKSSLVGHMRLHTGEKPFKCDFCEKQFAQRSSLREHRRTHTGEKPYICDDCPKSFTTASQLRSHKFCHSSDRTHLCQICGKGFSHAENFKYHMRRHNSEKLVQCPVCEKRFTESWTFKKHMRLHTGEKPYKCGACNKEFSDPSNFAKHKRTHSIVQKIETTFAETEQSMEEYLVPETLKENLIDGVICNDDITTTNAGLVVDQSGSYVTDGTSAIVQILDSEDLTYQTMTQDDEVEQVIYVYSGGPLFTFAMADENQAQEITADDEETVENLDVGALNAALESFNPNDIESHYYSLETVGDSTIAVPIQIPR